MPVSADRAYVSPTLVDAYLSNIGVNSQAQNDVIQEAINIASRFADSKSGWIFYLKNYVNAPVYDEVYGSGNFIIMDAVGNIGTTTGHKGIIVAPFRPIMQGTLVISENGTDLIEDTDYRVDYENGVIERLHRGAWCITPGTYLINCCLGLDNGTYDKNHNKYADYDATIPSSDIPGDIVIAVQEVASKTSGLWKREPVTDGNGRTTFWNPNDISARTMNTFKMYKLKRF